MYGRGDLRVESVPIPAPGPHELLLEVRAAGVCGSDVGEFFHGPKMFPLEERHRVSGHVGPMIPGHEFGGTIVEMGSDVEGFAVGDLVASGAGVSCGVCFQCRTGRTNLCVDYWTVGLQRNGGLAQYVAVPADACLEVGSMGLTPTTAALVQPMSIAVHAMGRGRPGADEPVAVIGLGGIGAFLAYALAQGGHAAFGVDLDPERVEIGRTLGLADAVVGSGDLHQDLRSLTPHPRVVYEVTGTEVGLAAALEVVAPGGRVVAVGLQKTMRSLDVMALSLSERELIGTNAHAFGSAFEPAARLIASRGDTGWDGVAPGRHALESLPTDVLPAMQAGTVPRIKTLFDPWLGVHD